MTDAIWWYERDGQQAGPVAHAAMLELVREGRILPSARVWRSGMAAWQPLSEVPELATPVAGAAHPAVPGPATAPPAVPGSSAPAPAEGAPHSAFPTSSDSVAPAAPDAPRATPDHTAAGGSAEPPLPGPTSAAEQEVADTRAPPNRSDAGSPSERRTARDAGTPPSASLPPPAAGPRPGATPAALPDGMEPVSSAVIVVLGVLTLGIYIVVRFFQAATAYEALAGRRSRFHLYFWLTIGLAVAGGPLHLLGALGWAAHVASVVFAGLTLVEVLADRKEAVRVQRIAPVLHSDTSHEALFIAGLLTVWLGVGLVLLLVQAVRFFEDHRAIAEELQARAWFPPGWPPPGPDAARPTSPPPGKGPAASAAGHAGARTCQACGGHLGAAARFCEHCGAATPAA